MLGGYEKCKTVSKGTAVVRHTKLNVSLVMCPHLISSVSATM